MRFPSVRAVVRTLLIELERSEAQPGPQLDEDGIINSVDETIFNTSPPERKALLTQLTTPGADFADRALVLCLVKLYVNFESWNCWGFGSCGRRSIAKVLVAVVGLFCNAWVHAPTIDESWNRFSTSSPPPFLYHETIDTIESPLSQSLTPEIWFEWSLLYDPWIRRTNAAQVLHPDEDTTNISPGLVAEVSQPEPEKEGRVVVKYSKKRDEERWAFKAILDSRWAGKTSRTGLQYLIDWEYAEPTWQPARDLSGCDQWVIEFHRGNHGKPGPLLRLKSFL
ncbi:reverse transcriptase domain protein [Colletotrichum incanum]|nr:reverse transcriptase domain protein [Colletotrichum incanum]